jgi:hypothetical protein
MLRTINGVPKAIVCDNPKARRAGRICRNLAAG